MSSSELLLQTISIGLRSTGLVRVVEADNAAKAQEGNDKGSQVEEALAGGDVGILLGTKDTENLVVIVDRLAEVSLLLRIPPAAVGISERSLHAGRVLVAAILSHTQLEYRHCPIRAMAQRPF